MQKSYRVLMAARVTGLFLAFSNLFELAARIGAGIVSAVWAEQLPADAWTPDLFEAIARQSAPFIGMAALGGLLVYWSRTAEGKQETGVLPAELQRTALAVTGGLMAAAGFYNLFLPLVMGYKELAAGLASPESVGYVIKAVLPNYVVLLTEMALGLWLVLGNEPKPLPASDVPEVAEEAVSPENAPEAEAAPEGDAPQEAAPEASPAAEENPEEAQ